jgi:hypothetical protein
LFSSRFFYVEELRRGGVEKKVLQNVSTPQHLNTSTPQHLNTSTPQHLNTSTSSTSS